MRILDAPSGGAGIILSDPQVGIALRQAFACLLGPPTSTLTGVNVSVSVTGYTIVPPGGGPEFNAMPIDASAPMNAPLGSEFSSMCDAARSNPLIASRRMLLPALDDASDADVGGGAAASGGGGGVDLGVLLSLQRAHAVGGRLLTHAAPPSLVEDLGIAQYTVSFAAAARALAPSAQLLPDDRGGSGGDSSSSTSPVADLLARYLQRASRSSTSSATGSVSSSSSSSGSPSGSGSSSASSSGSPSPSGSGSGSSGPAPSLVAGGGVGYTRVDVLVSIPAPPLSDFLDAGALTAGNLTQSELIGAQEAQRSAGLAAVNNVLVYLLTSMRADGPFPYGFTGNSTSFASPVGGAHSFMERLVGLLTASAPLHTLANATAGAILLPATSDVLFGFPMRALPSASPSPSATASAASAPAGRTTCLRASVRGAV